MTTPRFSSYKPRILIFGGTGSLGTALTKRLLLLQCVVGIFSRDEAKNYRHRLAFGKKQHDMFYYIGDVRNYDCVIRAICDFEPTIVINAAAMKQVPLCEEFIEEAIKTNIDGTLNIGKAMQRYSKKNSIYPLDFLDISTDKAVKPINAYGNTKALQERIHLGFNGQGVKANIVRYGNVLESTGSVIPFFKSLIAEGKPLTVTSRNMTRFLLSLDDAVDLVFSALDAFEYRRIFVPNIKSARIIDLAEVLLEAHGLDTEKNIKITGIRPGEKLDELLVSSEECERVHFDEEALHYCISPRPSDDVRRYQEADFSSGHENNIVNKEELRRFLAQKNVIPTSTRYAIGS